MKRSGILLASGVGVLITVLAAAQTSAYKYIRNGNDQDVTTEGTAGYALMGGGSDLDDAFRFLCKKGAGGDFLIVRAAGGDQAWYINWWQGTSVEDALNAHTAAGKPIGGTSAGLAVLAEYIYSAQGDAPDDENLTSAQALSNPYSPRVTVRHEFLKIPFLRNILTDSHFALGEMRVARMVKCGCY